MHFYYLLDYFSLLLVRSILFAKLLLLEAHFYISVNFYRTAYLAESWTRHCWVACDVTGDRYHVTNWQH